MQGLLAYKVLMCIGGVNVESDRLCFVLIHGIPHCQSSYFHHTTTTVLSSLMRASINGGQSCQM